MLYDDFTIFQNYYSKVSAYDLNKHWIPKPGHRALKIESGRYSDPISPLIVLNQCDVIFLVRENLVHEYLWLPTFHDLVCLYQKLSEGVERGYTDTFLKLISGVKEDSRTPEEQVLEIIARENLIDRKDMKSKFKVSLEDAQKKLTDRKENYLKEFI